MNNDLIRRSELEKAILDTFFSNTIDTKYNGTAYISLSFVLNTIDNAPTVEVTKPQSYVMGFCDGLKAQTYEKPPMFERPQGEWIADPLGNYVCNKCSWVVGKFERNFCPNCGAKMKGGTE